MLIIALILAIVGLAALVFAVVTSNALVAWVCIGASLLGVVLLIVDALQERRRRAGAPVGDESSAEESGDDAVEATYEEFDVEPADVADEADEADEAASVDAAGSEQADQNPG